MTDTELPKSCDCGGVGYRHFPGEAEDCLVQKSIKEGIRLQKDKLEARAKLEAEAALEAKAALELDLVNHPPHYSSHPSGIECIQVTEHFNFNMGNAIKYIWRADEKGNALQDLEKAKWYIEREIKKRKES